MHRSLLLALLMQFPALANATLPGAALFNDKPEWLEFGRQVLLDWKAAHPDPEPPVADPETAIALHWLHATLSERGVDAPLPHIASTEGWVRTGLDETVGTGFGLRMQDGDTGFLWLFLPGLRGEQRLITHLVFETRPPRVGVALAAAGTPMQQIGDIKMQDLGVDVEHAQMATMDPIYPTEKIRYPPDGFKKQILLADLLTGKSCSVSDLEPVPIEIRLADGRLYVAADRFIYAIEPATCAISSWHFSDDFGRTGEGWIDQSSLINSHFRIVQASARQVCVSAGSSLGCMDLVAGRVLWEKQLRDWENAHLVELSSERLALFDRTTVQVLRTLDGSAASPRFVFPDAIDTRGLLLFLDKPQGVLPAVLTFVRNGKLWRSLADDASRWEQIEVTPEQLQQMRDPLMTRAMQRNQVDTQGE